MLKSLKFSLLLLFLLALINCQEDVLKSDMWGALSPGAYRVGFRVNTFYDTNRNEGIVSEKGRPVEVMLWYPTTSAAKSPKLTFKDYLLLVPALKQDTSRAHIRKWLAGAISGDTLGISSDTLERIIGTEMQAIPDAPIINEKFPLVLWTMRHNTMVAQSTLCEYLASHGYVVGYARYAGDPLPHPWQMQTAPEKLAVFNTHLKDLNFALQCMANEPDVMPAPAAVITWSYAAEFAPVMQLQNPVIQLVLGLSSNPLSRFGLYQGNAAGSNLKPESLNVPYVVMSEAIGFDGNKRSAPAILDELPADAHYLSFRDLAHGNFNMLEGMLPGLFGIPKVQSWSNAGDAAQVGYETISRYALCFLNSYLKKDNRSYCQELEDHLPAGFIEMTQHGKLSTEN